MFRVIVISFILYLIYRLFKNFFFTKSSQNKEHLHLDAGQKMFPCDKCNVYVPESQLIKIDNKVFCSSDCAQKYIDENK